MLLEALHRARGGPVGYDELRDAGIEYPASVVSELELAGVPLERRYEGPTGARRLLGVRLDPRFTSAPRARGEDGEERAASLPPQDPAQSIAGIELFRARSAFAEQAGRALDWLSDTASAAARAARRAIRAAAPVQAPSRERARRAIAEARLDPRRTGSSPSRARRGSPPAPAPPAGLARARWLAPAALITAAAIVVALVLSALVGAGHAQRSSGRTVSKASSSARSAARAPSPAQPAPAAPATPASPPLAAQLEARGHALLEAGQFPAAVPVLEQALAATGENLSGCMQPVSETCLTYAYALYDLGRALRLDGQPAAAALMLERRLQIDNQRAVVQSELQLARRAAGGQAAIASTTG
jgi:tetratricopeptide (TPR) repeat protein